MEAKYIIETQKQYVVSDITEIEEIIKSISTDEKLVEVRLAT